MTQKKKQKTKTKTKTKSNPTDEVLKWVKEFVEVPHPVFADMPPCPYARQARLDGKVEFKEVTDMEPDSNLWVYIDRFDFKNKDVLVLIMDSKRWKPQYTKKLAGELNEAFKHKNILVMEDHPQLVEKVKNVVLNQGKHILFLCQERVKIQTFEKRLRKTDYYKNWSSKYEEEVTGSWRHPIKIEF